MSLSYTKGKTLVDLDWANDTIRMLLVTSSYTPDPDDDFVSDVSANEVVDVSGYSRVTLANRSISRDDVNNRVDFLADDYQYTSLEVTGVPKYAIIYRFQTEDADSELLQCITLPGTATNGGNYTIDWNSGSSQAVFRRQNAA
jgi:hypothetical protein